MAIIKKIGEHFIDMKKVSMISRINTSKGNHSFYIVVDGNKVNFSSNDFNWLMKLRKMTIEEWKTSNELYV